MLVMACISVCTFGIVEHSTTYKPHLCPIHTLPYKVIICHNTAYSTTLNGKLTLAPGAAHLETNCQRPQRMYILGGSGICCEQCSFLWPAFHGIPEGSYQILCTKFGWGRYKSCVLGLASSSCTESFKSSVCIQWCELAL